MPATELPTTGTPTDPIWSYIVVAGLVVLTLVTVFVIADSVLRAVLRRYQAQEVLRRWWADAEANRAQREEADRMLHTLPTARCLHRHGQWVCIAAPHDDAPARHYYVAAERTQAVS